MVERMKQCCIVLGVNAITPITQGTVVEGTAGTAPSDLEELLRQKYGATMNKSSYSGNNIGVAAEKGAWGRLLELLDSDRSTINSGATFGYSAIMTCGACPNDSDGSNEDPAIAALVMRRLIEAGCDINHTDNNSKNALHACAKFGGSIEQLSTLVSSGCNQHQRNGQGHPKPASRRYGSCKSWKGGVNCARA
eukprot:2144473-Prymnesium_polylepis.1